MTAKKCKHCGELLARKVKESPGLDGNSAPGHIICPNPHCSYEGPPKRIPFGSLLLGIVLLFFFIVPISPQAAKYGGSVVQGMREDAEFNVGIRNDATVMEDKIWQRHGFTSSVSLPHGRVQEPRGAGPERPEG